MRNSNDYRNSSALAQSRPHPHIRYYLFLFAAKPQKAAFFFAANGGKISKKQHTPAR
jgi:hypothetical protein